MERNDIQRLESVEGIEDVTTYVVRPISPLKHHGASRIGVCDFARQLSIKTTIQIRIACSLDGTIRADLAYRAGIGSFTRGISVIHRPIDGDLSNISMGRNMRERSEER